MNENWIVILAANIASRLRELQADSVVNNAELLEHMIAEASAAALSELIAQRMQVARMDTLMAAATALVQNADRTGVVVREDMKILREVLVQLGKVERTQPEPMDRHHLGIWDAN